MKKKFLSVLLSLAMCLSLLPTTAWATETHDHTSWTGVTELPTEAGDYNIYLTDNVTLSGTWTVPKGVTNLCLNGHVIKANCTDDNKFSVITVGSGATLNLYDCGTTAHAGYVDSTGLWHLGEIPQGAEEKTVTGGIITGGNAGNTGGGVCVISGKFNMYGGTIAGNEANMTGTGACAGGVYANGLFTMRGGAITNNTASAVSACGGGVLVYSNGEFDMSGGTITDNTGTGSGYTAGGVCFCAGTVTLGGTAQITDNTGSNLYLPISKFVTLGTDENVPTTMSVGVTMKNGTGAFTDTTNATAEHIKYFTSDSDSYGVTFTGNALALVPSSIPESNTWEALQAAINDAVSGGIVGLNGDVTAGTGNTTLTIGTGKNITLDLNGHVINANKVSTVGSVITVSPDANLTIQDSTIGTETAPEHYFTVGDNGLWTLTNAKTATTNTVTGGVITGGNATGGGNAEHGGGVYVDRGIFNMYGGSITGNTANFGGGVDDYGAFNMYGGSIAHNYATVYGGGVNQNGTFNMTGGSITNNTANSNGGGVYDNDGELTLGGTAKITGNLKGTAANNLYLGNNGGQKTVTLGTNGDAPATGFSVGVTMASNTGAFTGATIRDNAKYFASDNENYGIFLNDGNTLELGAGHIHDGTKFTEADTLPTGAGSYCLTGNVTLDDTWTVPSGEVNLCLNGHVIKQTVEASVITVGSGATLNLYDCGTTVRYWNKGDDGLWTLAEDQTTATDYTTTGGVITGGNTTNGGGVYVDSSGTFAMNGGNIVGNTATNNGGGVYVNVAQCFVAGTPITMADGSRKPIETLKIGDVVRVFDHENGEVSTAKLFDLWKYPEKHSGAVTLHFSHGIDLTVVYGHSFFDKTANKYVAVTRDNVDSYVDHDFYNVDNGCWETLIGYDFLDGEVDTYVITSEKHLNCVANGMLSNEDGFYTMLTNIFEYGDGLKINAEKKADDLERYGLFGYKELKYVSREVYDILNLQYLNVALGKGMVTKEAFQSLGAYWAEVDPELLCDTAVQQSVDEAGETCFLATATSVQNASVPLGVTLGGTAVITGNTAGGITGSTTKTANNLYLCDGATVTLGTGSGVGGNDVAVPSGMNVGVTMAEPGTGAFTTNGTAQQTDYFHADDSTHYYVNYNDDPGHLELVKKPAPSGGGSSTPTVTVPVTGDKDSVKVQASVSGGNATVKNVTSEQLETVGTGENVTIDLSSLSKSVSGVTIPKTTFENVAKSDADGLEVKLPNGTTAVFDSTTVAAVAEQAAGSNIQLVVDKENKAEQALTAAQKETVKALNDALVLDAYFVSNGKRISDFKGGEAELTVSYPTTKPVRVWYVAEDGTKELVPSTFDGKAATFVVTHFSHYAIEILDGSSYAACPQDNTCVYAKFTDANTAAWYHDGVHYCVENGMMNGVSNTQFAPSGTLTRGMVVTVLARLDGVTITSTGSEWYADGQAWAVKNGISDGTNMTGNITREQLATMLYRYAQFKGVDTNKFTENTNTLSHNDVFTISDWATSGMHFCIAAGVVNGDDNGNLNPHNTATRAEAAAMFQRFSEKVVK